MWRKIAPPALASPPGVARADRRRTSRGAPRPSIHLTAVGAHRRKSVQAQGRRRRGLHPLTPPSPSPRAGPPPSLRLPWLDAPRVERVCGSPAGRSGPSSVGSRYGDAPSPSCPPTSSRSPWRADPAPPRPDLAPPSAGAQVGAGQGFGGPGVCPAAPLCSTGGAGPADRRRSPSAWWVGEGGAGAGLLWLRFARSPRSAPSMEPARQVASDQIPSSFCALCADSVELTY